MKYEYKCRSCKVQFMIDRSITEPSVEPISCPSCGLLDSYRYHSAANQTYILKGGNWPDNSKTELSKRRGRGNV